MVAGVATVLCLCCQCEALNPTPMKGKQLVGAHRKVLPPRLATCAHALFLMLSARAGFHAEAPGALPGGA